MQIALYVVLPVIAMASVLAAAIVYGDGASAGIAGAHASWTGPYLPSDVRLLRPLTFAICGFSTSRNWSPIRLIDTMVSSSAMPGKKLIQYLPVSI